MSLWKNVHGLRARTPLSEREERDRTVPHTYYISRDLSDISRFQYYSNLTKTDKVTERCKFDGREPLFVERTIAISVRVLG